MGREASVSTLAAALLAALGIAPLSMQAATIIVTTTGDAVADPGCTLRNAIASMNTGAVIGNCVNTGTAFGTNDTISFDTAAFPSSGANTIALANGQLSITAYHLTIDATVSGNVTIDAQNLSRVMYDSANSGSLTLKHLTLSNGKATTTPTTNVCGGYSLGGGICSPHASLYLINSMLSGNSASYGGGAIFTIAGSIALTNSTLSGNSTAGKGGGIFATFFTGNVTLTQSTLSGNSALDGGGIYAGAKPVLLTNSTLSDNFATNGKGGAIFSGGTLTLTGSTLSGNSAANGDGGAIYSSGTGNTTLINSTLSGNSAMRGGGIYAYHPGNLTLTNATVSANTATTYGGGGVRSNAYNTVNNSIVAGNTQAGGPDLIPGFAAGANNLIGGDPLLGALADNGGPTQTMLPQTGSAAINAAPCLAGIDTDQRGYIRPDPPSRNTAMPCDIGAVEANSIPLSDEIFFNSFEP